MGVTPQDKVITIGFDCQFDMHLKDSTISSILAAFAELLPQLLADFFQKVLVGFGEHAMMKISHGRHGMGSRQRFTHFTDGWKYSSYRYFASDAGARCI